MKSCRGGPFENTLTPFRQKVACLDCGLVWKEKYTKVQKDEIWHTRHAAGLDEPLFYGSRCRKCSQDGVRVGPTFVACKTKKEWTQLKDAYEQGKIDLDHDFHFCKSTRDVAGTINERQNGRWVPDGIPTVIRNVENFPEEEQKEIREKYVVRSKLK